MRPAILAVLAALAGCTTPGSGPGLEPAPRPIESETISYETTPCYGTCPVYGVTVQPDGTGVFEGKRHTAVTGRRAFAFDPAAYRRFAAALAPYRPQGERLLQPGHPECADPPTDAPGVDIRWSDITGGGAHLSLYYGCGAEAMRDAIRAAPDALPIATFIGPR